MRFVFLFCFISFLTQLACQTQETTNDTSKTSGRIVKQVIITGNKLTKDFVITREMSLRIGSVITPESIAYDKERIYSLRLFNRVDIIQVPSDSSGDILLINVDERWYIFPVIVFGIEDHDWNKLYYGLGGIHKNFRGQNEQLYGAFALGYDPFLDLSYKNPRIDGDGDYQLQGEFFYQKVRNKSLMIQTSPTNYDQNYYNGSLVLGKRYGIATLVWTGISYNILHVSDYMPERTLTAAGTDRYFVLQAGTTYDTRDLGEYPRMGSFLSITMVRYGIVAPIDYWRFMIDARQFVPFTSFMTFAVRGFGNVVFGGGEIPVYDHQYIGYDNRVRGHYGEIMEGESATGISTELHIPLFEPLFIHAPQMPIQQFATWKFGIVGALFADVGQAWYQKTQLAMNHFIRGYGAGLHFLLAYSYVVRTEIGFNERGKSQIIIDLGAAF